MVSVFGTDEGADEVEQVAQGKAYAYPGDSVVFVACDDGWYEADVGDGLHEQVYLGVACCKGYDGGGNIYGSAQEADGYNLCGCDYRGEVVAQQQWDDDGEGEDEGDGDGEGDGEGYLVLTVDGLDAGLEVVKDAAQTWEIVGVDGREYYGSVGHYGQYL